MVKECFSLLKVMKYGKYLGIFPFDVVNSNDEYILKYSIQSVLSSFITILLLLLSGFWMTTHWAPRFVVILHHCADTSILIVCFVNMPLRRKKLQVFLNNITKVNDLIGKSQTQAGEVKWYVKLCIFGFILMSFLMFFDFFFFNYDKTDYTFWGDLKTLTITILTFYFDALLLLGYRNFVDQVEYRILLLQEFACVSLNCVSENKNVNEIQKINSKVHSINWRSVKNNEGKFDVHRSVEIYNYIFGASQALNDSFGLTILVSTLVCVMNLILAPYVMYVQNVMKNESYFLISSIAYVLGNIIKISLIVEPCHACSSQAKKFAQQLSTMSSYTLVRRKFMRRFYRMVDDCPIVYHMYEIMSINRSFYQAIMGGVTTYLVILFQLKYTEF